VVFVQSFAERPLTATIHAERVLRDPFTGERVAPSAGRARIALRARGVRMFVVAD
jgi:hypothetical protein